ncbi:HET-domain-containing protein [Hypoxylon sp. NC0597]|nr:HET-domain-containing protein [Hypoxylon sp. NC0597]
MHLLDVNTRRLKKYVEEKKGKVLFQDIESADHALLEKKRGFLKLLKCCDCSINRSDDTELQESINSMYRWYENADRCYVYLKDTSKPISGSLVLGEEEDWFKRGWTLQELVAPKQVIFYDRLALQDCSIAERMSWACDRETTKDEDRAYSLLGLFDVNIPMLYGEGEIKVFLRLQEEIIKISDDHSIFAWKGVHKAHGVLATSSEAFRGCSTMRRTLSHEGQNAFSMTNSGFSIALDSRLWVLDTYMAPIRCEEVTENYYARVRVCGQDFCHSPFFKARWSCGTPVYLRQPGTEAEEVGVNYKRLNGFRLSELLKSSTWKGKDQNAQEQFITFEPGNFKWHNVGELELSGYREFEFARVGFDFDFNPTLLLCESGYEFPKYFSICPLTKDEADRNNGSSQGLFGNKIEWNRVALSVKRGALCKLIMYNRHQNLWAIKGDRLNGLNTYINGTNNRIILAKTLTERQESV